MSTYVLALILITHNGSFMGTVTGFASKSLCDDAGKEFVREVKDFASESKYLCMMQK